MAACRHHLTGTSHIGLHWHTYLPLVGAPGVPTDDHCPLAYFSTATPMAGSVTAYATYGVSLESMAMAQ